MGGEKVLKFDPQSLSSASKKQKGDCCDFSLTPLRRAGSGFFYFT
jgi:hypothetical protein